MGLNDQEDGGAKRSLRHRLANVRFGPKATEALLDLSVRFYDCAEKQSFPFRPSRSPLKSPSASGSLGRR